MRLSFYIARRYLFSKKSHNAINIISSIAVCGVALATMAMVCTMSVFNGFQNLVAGMFSSFDPELKVLPAKGKVFDSEHPSILKLEQFPSIETYSKVLEDNVLIKYDNRQVPALLKGVSNNFGQLVLIDSCIFDGKFRLSDEVNEYATLGIGLAAKLGVNAGFSYPVEIYAPKRNAKVNTVNPASSFTRENAYITGVFCVNQPIYDDNILIVPIELSRRLFFYDKEISSLELKLKPDADIEKVQAEIENMLGSDFVVKNRYQQQEASFKMMNVEKGISFLMLCFILIITVFNVTGSLSMLVIEKQKDVLTLRNLGADNRLITNIFLFEGWLISIMGAIFGILLGLLLCWLQIEFGLLKFGESGTFTIDNYPVEVIFTDVIYIFITVLIIGFLGALYPVYYLSKKWLNRT